MSEPTAETPVPTEKSQQLMPEFIVDAATDAVLRVHLDKFEGPLEVLLYLIRAQEIDIFDIPIVTITDQYLKFIDLLNDSQLDVAGEYLVMAATLIQIKSKMILPNEIDDDEEELIEEEDPRMELVEKLIAYRQYRDAAARLQFLEAERLGWFTRNDKPRIEAVPDEEDYVEVSLYDLAQAFKGVLKFIPELNTETVAGESCSVDERIDQIEELLTGRDSVSWTDLFRACENRMQLVCTFLAVLELSRMRRIRVHQHAAFGDFRVFRALPESNAA